MMEKKIGFKRRIRSIISLNPPLFLFIFSFIVCMGRRSHSQTDTIIQGQRISYWDSIVSAGGIYELAFFTPYPYASNNSYLGIRYRKTEDKTVVWVANRNNPIPKTSGVFMIDDVDGKLKITYEGAKQQIVLNSNTDQAISNSSNLITTLLDTGNFVLKEKERVFWQSFDHPTDTLLPGMRLGFNLKTGHNWTLTSCLNDKSLAPGAFTLGMDPNGTRQLVVWWRGEIYWKSGVWNADNKSFPYWKTGYNPFDYGFSYISNEDEKYFVYFSDANLSWVMNIWGGVKIYDSNNRNINRGSIRPCEPSDNDTFAGCVNRCQCWSSSDNFRKISGYFWRGEPKFYEYDEDSGLGIGDCGSKCRSNCSCIGFSSYYYYDGTGCKYYYRGFRIGGQRDYQIDGFFLDTFFSEENKNKQWWLSLSIGIAIAAASLVIVLLCALSCLIKIRRLKDENTRQANLLRELGTNMTPHKVSNKSKNKKDGKNKDHDELKVFSFISLVDATNNFSYANKLGQGGFGPVYKGKLFDGQEIAVKRLSRSSGQGLVEFKNEIVLIAKLQHTNLVRLLGCCIQGEEMMLIYEYMPNKSLDSFLFDPIRKDQLDWRKRFNIIEGIAQGLLYLHKYSRLRVIHRDLKAGNILLDNEMNPKISDFGMARIFGKNESEANTDRLVGTYGYMSPEYAMKGIFSVKSDVFSFGVLLLEIVSGRKNNCFNQLDAPLNLVGYAWELWKEGNGLKLMDLALGVSCSGHEVLRCIQVGLLCVQQSAADRPTMPDVVSMLSNETTPLQIPKQPAFFIEKSIKVPLLPNGNSKSCSLNGVSISSIDGR